MRSRVILFATALKAAISFVISGLSFSMGGSSFDWLICFYHSGMPS